MKRNRLVMSLLGALFVCSASWLVSSETTLAAVIRVPADQPTINAGLSAAQNGDTVLVADGVYTGKGARDIVFRGKEIKLISENGPRNCIIDGQGVGNRAFRCTYDPGHPVIRGFTIRNFLADSYDASAFHIVESSPIIQDCIMENNRPTAIRLYSSSAQIRNCSIIGSRQSIVMKYSTSGSDKKFSPTISNCLISGIRASSWHGIEIIGLFSAKIVNCTVVNASIGISISGKATPRIVNSIVYYNWRDLSISRAAPSVVNCDFKTMSYRKWCKHPAVFRNNITNEPPQFVDHSNRDYHLLPGSSGVDAGQNSYVKTNRDLDGNRRIVNGTVDMGAYEVQ